MIRKWGEQVIRSRQYAAGVALVIAFFSFFNMPIGWLSSVIVALVTLQNGPRHGLIVIAWAVLPAVAMLCLGQYGVFLNIALLHYLVVWALAVILRKNNSWIPVLQLSALVGMVGVIVIHYMMPELQNWIVDQFNMLAKEYKTFSFFNFRPTDIDIVIKYMSVVGTGMLVLALVLTNLMTLFLARWWQSSIVANVSAQKECYAIRMHYGAALLLLVIGAGLYADNNLFINVLIVAFVPFIFAGLSLLHAFIATKKNGNAMLVAFYILFLILSPYVVLLLTFMGWVDSFINFRKRLVSENAIEE